jgi:hypothetical protein
MTFSTGGIAWTRVSVPRLLSRVGLGLYSGSALLAAIYALLSPANAFVGVIWTALVPMLSAGLVIASYILSLGESWTPGVVTVSEADVTVRGSSLRVLPRAQIISALEVDRPVGDGFVPTVELELRSGDRVTVRLREPAEARGFIEALGFGPRGARATVSLARPTRRLIHPLLGIVAYGFGTVVGGLVSVLAHAPGGAAGVYGATGPQVAAYFLSPLFSLALYFAMKRMVRPARITVGDDGVVLEGATRRFLRRSTLARVERGPAAPLIVRRSDGTTRTVRGVLLDAVRISAVAQLLEARLAETSVDAARRAEYGRTAREPAAAWREKLRAAIEQGGYREAASPVADAAAVVKSPRATAEERVGAALALRVAGEPPERIRVAAKAVVDDDVREALEAVAADDDARIDRALGRLARSPAK